MIYVFDLDGTLCETDGMNYPAATPKRARIQVVNDLFESGHWIVIDTARGSGTKDDWHELTVIQLREWGVKYHELRTGHKIFGHIYVDDRAFRDTDFFAAVD